jgi:hypothetical protein
VRVRYSAPVCATTSPRGIDHLTHPAPPPLHLFLPPPTNRGGGGGNCAGASSDPSNNNNDQPSAESSSSSSNTARPGGALTTAVFGVLYTLAKEKISESRAVALLSVVVDFLLIGGILLLPEYPWALPAGHGLQKLVYYIEFHLPIARTVSSRCRGGKAPA